MDNSIDLKTILKTVRSSLPGRLRLRLPQLVSIDSDSALLITQWIESHGESIAVSLNPRVGSLLITWDPNRDNLDTKELFSEAAEYLNYATSLGIINEEKKSKENASTYQIENCAKSLAKQAEFLGNGILDRLSPYIAYDIKQKARKRRVTQNRLMLASLLFSVGVLATSQTKSHVLFGGAFLALLTVHLLQHRKVL